MKLKQLLYLLLIAIVALSCGQTIARQRPSINGNDGVDDEVIPVDPNDKWGEHNEKLKNAFLEKVTNRTVIAVNGGWYDSIAVQKRISFDSKGNMRDLTKPEQPIYKAFSHATTVLVKDTSGFNNKYAIAGVYTNEKDGQKVYEAYFLNTERSYNVSTGAVGISGTVLGYPLFAYTIPEYQANKDHYDPDKTYSGEYPQLLNDRNMNEWMTVRNDQFDPNSVIVPPTAPPIPPPPTRPDPPVTPPPTKPEEDYWKDNAEYNATWKSYVWGKSLISIQGYGDRYWYYRHNFIFDGSLNILEARSSKLIKQFVKAVKVKVYDPNYGLHGAEIIGGVYKVVDTGKYEIIIYNSGRHYNVTSGLRKPEVCHPIFAYDLPASDANKNYRPEKVYNGTYKIVLGPSDMTSYTVAHTSNIIK